MRLMPKWLVTCQWDQIFLLNFMSSFTSNTADDVAIATIRTLAVDVVGKANSGHPGLFSISYFFIKKIQKLI